MTTRHMTTVVGFALTAGIFLVRAAVAEPSVRTDHGVAYVSGGVGTEERQALESMAHFNLKLTMASSNGHFVSDAQVRIQDAQGRTLVDTVADGPLLLAELKPGTYTVTCSLNGKAVKQTTSITSGTQQQLTFTWASD